MTNHPDIQARIADLQTELETGNLHHEHRMGLATELQALIIATRLDQMAVAIYETATPIMEPTDTITPNGPPGTPEFENQVEDLAARLWETDQGRSGTAARKYSEEYSAVQDRYRDQAAYLLAPELMDENGL